MEKLLHELAPEQAGVVKSIRAEGKIRRRLFDMGVTPSAKITMRKVAPMGDPIEVTVRGYELTLLKSEAQTVLVEVEA